MDLLMDFDPENPPQADDPQALQLWLECAAQQEAVHRYQKLIDNARERKDYSSLSMVQRQVLRWFQPLKDEIASRQKEYVLKESSGNNKNFNKASQRYGPYICALPPEKLAVIVAHEAIMFALLKSGSDGREGVPFISMARRLGEAVEEEVLIHRILHKRFKDGQLDKSKGFEGLDNDDDAPEDVIEGLLAPSTQGDDAPDPSRHEEKIDRTADPEAPQRRVGIALPAIVGDEGP
jgi:DNA-directed RNA polymerase